jgi:hypothetical protein
MTKKQTRSISITVPIIFSILLVAGFTGVSHSFNDALAATTSATSIHTTVFWSLNVPTSKIVGNTFTIDGKLRDNTASQFLASKTISFTSSPPMAIPNAVTDSNGFYSVSGLVASVAGSYSIQAHFAGDSQYTPSNSITKVLKISPSIIPTPIPVTAPQLPTGLGATTSSSTQINLSWTAPANNGGSAITGYKIERSANGGTTWSLVANTGTTTYSDTGLASSTTYTYRVSAINAIGTSSPSNTASAITAAAITQQRMIGIFSPGATQSSLLGSNDYVHNFRTDNLVQYTPLHKIKLFYCVTCTDATNSLDSSISIAKSSSFPIEYLGYDIEKSNADLSSPTIEVNSPAFYTAQAADLVHASGFKFATDPTWSGMQSSYKSIDWSKVDLVGIQAQTNTSDPSFTSTITSEVNLVRSQNPNILIFVQVNQDLDTTSNIVTAIKSVKNLIDGVNMVCQSCDVTTMNNLITQLRAL